MFGIRFLGEGRLETSTDHPEPAYGPSDVKIALRMSGICGTDLHSFGHPGRPSLNPPADTIPGHEVCGTVAAVGDAVTGFAVGDRVVANHIIGCGLCEYCRLGAPHFCPARQRIGREVTGSMGQFVVAPERNVFRLDDELSFVDGALMACNFGTAYAALRRAGASGAHTVAVFGLGPVGLCVVLAARALGAGVIGVEPNAHRRELARRTGGVVVVDPSTEDPVEAARGVDIAVDVTGVPVAQNQALDATRALGTTVLLGVGGETRIDPFRQLIAKDLTVIGSYTYKLGEFADMSRFLRRHRLSLRQIVTSTYPPQQAEAAFQEAVSGSSGKILFDWSGVDA